MARLNTTHLCVGVARADNQFDSRPCCSCADHWIHEERDCSTAGEQSPESPGIHEPGGRDGDAAIMITNHAEDNVLAFRRLSFLLARVGVFQRYVNHMPVCNQRCAWLPCSLRPSTFSQHSGSQPGGAFPFVYVALTE